MGEVTYVRTSKQGVIDYTSAIIDIVSLTPEPAAMSESPITMTGHAHKHGYLYCTWKKRFFKLDGKSLSYYKKEKATTPKGTIPLTPYSLCRRCEVGEDRAVNALGYIKLVNGMPQPEKITREHGLSLSCPEHERTYYIHFSSSGERDSWLNSININIELQRRQKGVIEDMISRVKPLAESGTIRTEKYGILKMALRGRFNPRIDASSHEPLIQAMMAVTVADLELLRDCEVDRFINQQTPTGTTLLIKACTIGAADIVAYLLRHEASPSIAKKDGDTPLIVAARLNHIEIAMLLLDYNASKDCRNIYGETPLSEGQHKDHRMVDLLTDYEPQPHSHSSSRHTSLNRRPSSSHHHHHSTHGGSHSSTHSESHGHHHREKEREHRHHHSNSSSRHNSLDRHHHHHRHHHSDSKHHSESKHHGDGKSTHERSHSGERHHHHRHHHHRHHRKGSNDADQVLAVAEADEEMEVREGVPAVKLNDEPLSDNHNEDDIAPAPPISEEEINKRLSAYRLSVDMSHIASKPEDLVSPVDNNLSSDED